jgi:diguanylate cyclase (GGDEF)-like protein
VSTSGHQSFSALIEARHADGSVRWLDVIATNLLDDPSVRGVVCNARDVTEAHELSERLHHQASHDPLTQLANRNVFDDRVSAARAASEPSSSMAVLMIDLDDFKPVNDLHGHGVGDALLVEVAARIRSCVRSADTVARLGGDEFAVLLPGADPDRAVEIAHRIIAAVQEAVPVGGNSLRVSASVGVAVGPPDLAGTLLRDADAAMYLAKRGGKGRCERAVAVS